MTEKQLIKAIARGELPALEELIDRYTPYVSSVVSRILRGRQADVEELTADVFLAAWDNRDRLRPGKVKGWVLANVKAPAPAKKGRLPGRKKVLLAAALAAVLVLLVGAGLPQRVYQLLNGTVSFTEDVGGRTIAIETQEDPIKLENGRLFLIQDGESTDITDIVSETKPYIIDNSSPDEDMVNYRIVGGTPEHYGWFEWIAVPDPFGTEDAMVYEDGRVHTYHFGFTTIRDGERYPVGGVGVCDPDWGMFADFNEDVGIEIDDFQWLRAAAEELGIPFMDTTGEIATTIYK